MRLGIFITLGQLKLPSRDKIRRRMDASLLIGDEQRCTVFDYLNVPLFFFSWSKNLWHRPIPTDTDC